MKILMPLQAASSTRVQRKHLKISNDKVIGTWKADNNNVNGVAAGCVGHGEKGSDPYNKRVYVSESSVMVPVKR